MQKELRALHSFLTARSKKAEGLYGSGSHCSEALHAIADRSVFLHPLLFILLLGSDLHSGP